MSIATQDTQVSPLRLRRVMGRNDWEIPEPFGPGGWSMRRRDHGGSIIVTEADGFTHASIAWTDHLPTYEELGLLHRAVWGDDGFAYQQFVPTEYHVNIHQHALHLWGRVDGAPVLPYADGGSV